jgi:hypothetical protein
VRKATEGREEKRIFFSVEERGDGERSLDGGGRDSEE